MPPSRHRAHAALPHRGPAGEALPATLAALPLPPGPVPRRLGGRPLKRWRWIGAFAEELMVCAADVRVGPARQTFWAVWDRRRRTLHGRTRLRGGGRAVDVTTAGALRVRDGDVAIDLEIGDGAGVVAVTAHGREHAWTAKHGGVPARGTVRVGRRTRRLDGRAIVDDTAAYYARRTAWRWSAGVGEAADGRPVAWNLVRGVGDPERGSERTVWVDGVPEEAGVARFAPDLSGVSTADGGDLRFVTEAVRERRERLVVVSSAYRQPFGTFTGVLPGGLALARGLGVMEDHVARW